MCTVSFIPDGDKVFITHNRDEKSSRSMALAPREYTMGDCTVLFPRDGEAGGSWIGCNQYGAAAVLLNGGFVKHQPDPSYSKSRGLVFLDILATDDLLAAYRRIELNGIEPFTVILWEKDTLSECRWDGFRKHITTADANLPHTWSSVTLYEPPVIAKRENWFQYWLLHTPRPSAEDIIQFHLSAGDGDTNNDLRMNRDGKMLTVSVTAMEIQKSKLSITYIDLQSNTRTMHSIHFSKAPAIHQ